MPRIVSLIASATEIAWALGYGDQLVGRSHECDFPEVVKRLPSCTEPKFAVTGSSAEIDGRVRAALADSPSVYRVDAELLRRLRPDVILTQAQCEVCAVSLRDVEQAVCGWVESRPTIVSLLPNCLADVWSDMRRTAAALGNPGRGEEEVGALRERMAAIADRAKQQSGRPTLFCVEWIEPLMAAGNWMPELVEMAGGVPLLGATGAHSPTIGWQQLVERDPDVIVVMPCGWDQAKARQEMPALTCRPEWPRLKAVRAGQVFLADGNQFFNRPGPRLVESLEILAEILHPRAFHFGHEGSAWERF